MPAPAEKVLFCFNGADLGYCLIKWLLEQGYDVVGFLADVGEEDEEQFEHTVQQLYKVGCSNVFTTGRSCRSDFICKFVYTAVQAKCALGVPLSAPCVAREQMAVAKREGIGRVAHGARGDAQIQLELVYYCLDPLIDVIVPWRMNEFLSQFPEADALEQFRQLHGLPDDTRFGGWEDLALRYVPVDDLDQESPLENPGPCQDIPAEVLRIEFKDGAPVRVSPDDGTWEGVTDPIEIFECLNQTGRRHGIGLLDVVEDLEVGVKGRVFVESPGQTILAVAHADIEGIAMDREVIRLRDLLSPRFTGLVRGGCWFSPEMDFITAAVSKSQELIDGVVCVKICHGTVCPVSRESRRSLFDRELQSMAIPDRFDPSDAAGFIRLHSLRLRAHHVIMAKHTPRAPSRWPPGTLTLADGTSFEGRAFGQPISVSGEVVFSTGAGYIETLTDPSYRGQIVVLTVPLIGNSGVPSMVRDAWGLEVSFESFGGKIQAAGLVVSEYCEEPSHWNASTSLSQWLKSQNVPAIMMVDTRAVVKYIRERGSVLGKITSNYDVTLVDPNKRCLAQEVCVQKPVQFGSGDIEICCVDVGVKLGILRSFLEFGVTVKVVPWDWSIESESYDGIFISNGPGDPAVMNPTVQKARWALQQDKPVLGICMGCLIVGLAAGCRTYKLQQGHRGSGHPCTDVQTQLCVITTQNHGYAIDRSTIPADWEEWYVNTNDGTNEGIRHKTKPFGAVMFHPDAAHSETKAILARFIQSVREAKLQEYVRNRPRSVVALYNGSVSGSECLRTLVQANIKVCAIHPPGTALPTGVRGICTQHTVCNVESVLQDEHPDALVVMCGDERAAECALRLHRSGALKQHSVRLLGPSPRALECALDGGALQRFLKSVGINSVASEFVSTVAEAVAVSKAFGYPVVCCGRQKVVLESEQAVAPAVEGALATCAGPIAIERTLVGWKEVEVVVVRDVRGNSVAVLGSECVDFSGVNVSDSVITSPTQTITTDEYNALRSAALTIARELSVVGVCSVLCALESASANFVVQRIGLWLDRETDVAGAVTGYPVPHVATKLVLGDWLSSIKISAVLTSCFEPSLDYVSVRVPLPSQWDRPGGGVLGIGKTFQEAFQKAFRMAGGSVAAFLNRGYATPPASRPPTCASVQPKSAQRRLVAVVQALQAGVSVNQIHEWWSGVDCWFLEKMRDIVQLGSFVAEEYTHLRHLPGSVLWELKTMGFSDASIAHLLSCTESDVRDHRRQLKVTPFVKQIDSAAGEHATDGWSLYTTYSSTHHDVEPLQGNAMLVLIPPAAASYEHSTAVAALEFFKECGTTAVCVTCNPAMVPPCDLAARVYIDDVSLEKMLDVCEREQQLCVLTGLAGAGAQDIALQLAARGVTVAGADDMAAVAHFDSFARLCASLHLHQPPWKQVADSETATQPRHHLALSRNGARWRAADTVHDWESSTPVRWVSVVAVADGGSVLSIAVVGTIGYCGGQPVQVCPHSDADGAQDMCKSIAEKMRLSGPIMLVCAYADEKLYAVHASLNLSHEFVLAELATGFPFVKTAVAALCRMRDVRSVAAQRLGSGRDACVCASIVPGKPLMSTGGSVSDAIRRVLAAGSLALPVASVLICIGDADLMEVFAASIQMITRRCRQVAADPRTAAHFAVRGLALEVASVSSPSGAQIAFCLEASEWAEAQGAGTTVVTDVHFAVEVAQALFVS
eukprot:TRINITY_DN9891_c0_g1_i1.p1 TRINITY_DN9891_c0_g1~~TRINITY_DN9891_c0_g1_i1.p1  ORF type:complete len:1706 (+),score=209.42 TRINITY_DN9891_c0_g1_i1:110-5227(+)